MAGNKSSGGGGRRGRVGFGGRGARAQALNEFRFLERRLAAGGLKRGERASINRRRENLARIVYGVK